VKFQDGIQTPKIQKSTGFLASWGVFCTGAKTFRYRQSSLSEGAVVPPGLLKIILLNATTVEAPGIISSGFIGSD
jgi:hypothetical protein